jgi:uncharacterized lipoprotein YddW (UPF0748 family)
MISPAMYRKWAWPAERRFFGVMVEVARRYDIDGIHLLRSPGERDVEPGRTHDSAHAAQRQAESCLRAQPLRNVVMNCLGLRAGS